MWLVCHDRGFISQPLIHLFIGNNLNHYNQADLSMRLPFLEWAFNSRNNTVDNVIELITILDSIEKKPEEQTRNGRNAR